MRKAIWILMAAILFCGWSVNADTVNGEKTYEWVVVEQNDTLWDIAARKVDNQVDIREYIYRVEKLNHLDNPGSLQPGKRLKLPPVIEK